ncbi:MAG: DMT family transporter [Acidobacteria bacterium]|nr:DMT family transporter [Acidobacteriota bacterium]
MHSRAGLALSLLTAALWGSLPVVMKPLAERLDFVTITWIRYLAAAAGMAVFLRKTGGLPDPRTVRPVQWLLLCVAFGGFLGNNFGYLIGLRNTSASTAQILIQLAPILVIFGAAYFFKEHFGRWQAIGVSTLIAGILLFFHHKLIDFGAADSNFNAGVGALLCAAVVWAIYALAQKKLLQSMSSVAVMAFVYAFGSVLMAPFATPTLLKDLDGTRVWLLAYACLNSLLGYGFFSEALARWEAGKVSAVVALAPLFTVFFSYTLAWLLPGFVAVEPLDAGNIAGAVLVVAGCMMTSLGRSTK